jgi:hypothetical protein
MKTAQGAISVDVSQFNSSIDSAKARLTAFGAILSKIGSVASTTWKAFDMVAGVSEKISTIAKAGRDLQSIFNALPSIMSKVGSAFNALKGLGSQLITTFSKLPASVKILGVASITTAGSIFVLVKAIQGLYSVSKSAISVVGSITGKIVDMGKSALKATGSVISSAFSGLGSILKGVAVGVAGLATAFAGLAIFVANGVKGIFELGDGYKTLRDRTGASIPFIFALEKAFKANGVSAQMVGPALNNMQKALSGLNEQGEPTNKWFEKLNLKIEDLQKLSPDQQFKVISKAIAELENPAQRTAAAIGIFGRTGASMIGVFKEVDSIGEKLDPSAKILEQNAERFSRISTRLKESGNFFKGFFIAIAGSVAPELERILNLMQGGDFMAGIGEKVGAQLKFGLDVFLGALENNSVGEVLKMSFDFALLYLKDLLARTFEFSSVLLAKFLEADVASGLIAGLGSAFMGALSMISGTLLKAFSAPLAFFSAGIITAIQMAIQFFVDKFPKIAKLAGVEGFSAGTFGENYQDQKNAISGFADATVTSGFDSIKEGIQTTIDNAVAGADILKNALKEFPPQSKEVQDALENVTSKLKATAEIGKQSGAFIGPMQPQGKGTALNPVVTSPKTASDAISSLQRIGGGGGGLGIDPLLNVNQKQLDEQKKQTDIWKNIDQKFGRFSGITEAQGAVLGR